MEVFEAVRTLRAVRQYQDRPISDDIVRKIVESAHVSASSMNLQPWHFVVVKNKDSLIRLGEHVRTGPYIAGAQLAVVVAIEKESRFAVSDASRAVQDMMLTAWSEGIGSNWTGFGGLDDVRDLVNLPSHLDVLAVVPFGYPAQAVGRGKKQRKPWNDVVSLEQYGQPMG